jgi:hypothetical protein
MMLGHSDPHQVFNKHYLHSMENIPLVKLQLGEVGGDNLMVDVCISFDFILKTFFEYIGGPYTEPHIVMHSTWTPPGVHQESTRSPDTLYA